MKQIVQNLRNGQLSLLDVPTPIATPGEVLIANQASLISAGTERMTMDLAKKSLLGKARERPDQVRRVLEKIRNEGLWNTIQQVKRKLDDPMTMGYSSAGIVIACGAGVQHFKPGDRVASNGPHAEIVSVPKNLCARVPDDVPFDQACFAVLGSIALQGLRLSKNGLGDSVFIIGLGLIGQLAVALAKAAGMYVIGTDLDAGRCELALKMGADEARPSLSGDAVASLTGGHGADAVVITASTKSNGPIELAASAVRKRGRVVLVGVIGLELDRRPFYFKEAEFVVSCSYGPGRYDPNYEEYGHDYPLPYVRWTEQRNIQAVLDLMGKKTFNVEPLISHRFPVDEALRAYDLIGEGGANSLGVVLEYPQWTMDRSKEVARSRVIQFKHPASKGTRIRCGVLGAGNFAKMVLLPAIQKSQAFELVSLCSPSGLSARHIGAEAKFEKCTSEENEIFDDPSVQTVFSITRHDQHARHVLAAIRSGKSIFVEKPLCLTLEELREIDEALAGHDHPAPIMVGFNRRFAPSVLKLKKFLGNSNAPWTVSIRFNAGDIPADHWTQDDAIGGGRIIGEACHAIDLATFLCGSPPIRVFAESILDTSSHRISDDQCFITLRHANGSISSIGYLAGGDKAFPKERIEVIGNGQVGVIDDYKLLTYCRRGKSQQEKFSMDKGHESEIVEWSRALAKGTAPIPWSELRAVTLATLLAVQSLREGVPFNLTESQNLIDPQPS